MPIPMPRISVLLQIVAVLLAASASSLSNSDAQEPAGTRSVWLERARAAQDKLAEQLSRVQAAGRIEQAIQYANRIERVVTLDASLLVAYDAPRLHVRVNYDQRLEPSPATDEATEWLASNVIRHDVIFDGEQVSTIEWTSSGECRGSLYFDFGLQKALRVAGLPVDDPVRLWEAALDLDGSAVESADITALGDGGVVGEFSNPRYRMKFYSLGNFEFDLRRISSYRPNENQPFRDTVLTWRKLGETWYVDRFATRLASGENESERLTRQTTIEYSVFALPESLPESAFKLESLELPEGTLFEDFRLMAEGSPVRRVWSDGGLDSGK